MSGHSKTTPLQSTFESISALLQLGVLQLLHLLGDLRLRPPCSGTAGGVFVFAPAVARGAQKGRSWIPPRGGAVTEKGGVWKEGVDREDVPS